ncbi:MAG: hypothetical protein V7678_08915 [Brevundimonas sp.]
MRARNKPTHQQNHRQAPEGQDCRGQQHALPPQGGPALPGNSRSQQDKIGMAKNRFTASWPWSSLRRSSPLTTWARDPESDPDKTDPERQARRLFHDVGLIAEALGIDQRQRFRPDQYAKRKGEQCRRRRTGRETSRAEAENQGDAAQQGDDDVEVVQLRKPG